MKARLAAIGPALVFASTVLLVSIAPAQTTDDYAAVRARLRAAQTGGDRLDANDPVLAAKVSALNNSAQTHWNNLNKASARTLLWSDLTISPTKSDTITPVFERLKTLAAAFATPGAALKGNPALRDDIVSGLEWLNRNHYSLGRSYYDNWFPWHLAVPLNLVDIFACLHDGLDAQTRIRLYAAYASAVDFYQASAGPTYANTGANRVWRSRIDVGLGAALESAPRLASGRDKLSVVLPYVTIGDGFYADGSFIQHNTHSYTGGYGLYLISELSAVLEAIAATPWAVTDSNVANVFRWVDEAYAPVMFRGAIMDCTRGREISRAGSTDHASGHPTLTAIARVAQFAEPAAAARLRSRIKGQLQSDVFRNFLNTVGLSAAGLVKPILDDPTLPAAPALTGCFVFSGMDRVVHHRGSWAYAVSLSSKRISKYESINAENLRGWHLGDGAAYLYNGDLGHYADQYWPTADPYRLAGITVDKRTRTNAGTSSPNTIDPRTTRAWVGGSTVLGEFGSAGMDHEAAQSDLRARKSWFFFDNEVVQLGAGIVTSTANPHRVETIVEHRQLTAAGSSGPATFTANGVVRAALPAAQESLDAVRYAHLALPKLAAYGNADIGYVFPTGPVLHVLREARTGSYNLINQGPFTNSNNQTRSYLTLWFDHGAELTGSGAAYAYVVLPGASATQTAAYSQTPDVEILVNTIHVQAVRDRKLRATGINFWSAGTVDGIVCDQPASLTLLEREGQLHLGFSDPTQETTTAVTLEFPYSGVSVVARDPLVTVLSLSPRLRLSFAVAGTRGRSLAVVVQLRRTPSSAPVVRQNPSPLALPAGSTAAFNVGVAAEPAPSYQWSKNGAPVAGATSDTLILSGITASDAGDYTCTLTNPLGTVTTRPASLELTTPPASPTRLTNLSVRSLAGTGAQTLTVGFVIGRGEVPADSKSLLLRGIGPTLAAFGLAAPLADPSVTLFAEQTKLSSNDDWAGEPLIAAASASVGAFPLAGPTSKDAALVRSGMGAGAYTLQISGPESGVALGEIYDTTPGAAFTPTTSRLINVSARSFVGVGGDRLITGFVIAGLSPQTVLVRAIGGTLAAFGVAGSLDNPRLELFSGSTKLLENDDWSGNPSLSSTAARVGAFILPVASKDAALVATLPPGAYTAQVTGVAETTGIALVEVYEVP
ncbi:MAG TPA: polysaccharide lyase family 8 super-sandwich domain-containing protein [Opitutaceae bacterium]|nr:polysaccharide lyase family 8 super-sandwich domain-containing protein [Opitutaceae bacterium]